mgnify:FL=1
MRLKVKTLILFIFFLIITIYLGNYYRPYVYSNKIDDYGLADVGYNIIAVVNMSLFSWLGFYRYTKNKIVDIILNTTLYLSFELISYFISLFGVFDIKDCFALLIGGLFSIILLYLVDKKLYLNDYKRLSLYFPTKNIS